MKRTFLALHFEGGAVHEFELLDGYYVIGGDAAANLRIDLPTVAPRHLALAIVWGKVQVEPFVQGIVVNGYEIAERVEVELPASVEFPGVVMMLRHEEVEAEDPDKTIPFARRPAAQSLDPDKTITVARPREAAPVDPDATIVRPRQPGGANFGGTLMKGTWSVLGQETKVCSIPRLSIRSATDSLPSTSIKGIKSTVITSEP